MSFETVVVDVTRNVCRIRLNRPEAGNALNARMVDELTSVVASSTSNPEITVLVLEGSAEIFCSGGDFETTANGETLDPVDLYDLWTALATGPFVSIALVQGRANAGGVGLAASCDLVLAARAATFALSELLFGLFPACVMPFLIRRTGAQRAHYLTLMTRPIPADEALAWGLADAVGDNAHVLLKSHLTRLSRLTKPVVGRYKRYMSEMTDLIPRARTLATETNRALFEDETVRKNIRRYATEMKFPWEE